MSVIRKTTFVCDQCGRTEAEERVERDTKPWWELHDSHSRFDKLFCAPSCLSQWLASFRQSTYGTGSERP